MHPTVATPALIYLNRAGRRVMPGVMPPERGWPMAQQARPASPRRP